MIVRYASVDQGQGLIAEHEGRIKQRANSNPAISLNRRSTPRQIDLQLASVPLPTSSFPLRSLTIVLNVMLVGTPQSSLIVDLLRDHSRPMDQVEWKDRISKAKGMKSRIPEFPIVVGSL
jgi:hypothetical protein